MKVSIIIPAYNSEDTIERAVSSALDQDFQREETEIIVVNDGSTDNTLETLRKYGEQIKIINQENQGAVKAANQGFKIAKGEYVIKLDSDDYFTPSILKEMVEVFNNNPELNFVYCDYFEKSENGKTKTVSTKNIFNTLSVGVMIKRESFEKEGFYREDIKFPEYDLLLKTEEKWSGHRIPKPLFYYIRMKNSITGNKEWVKTAFDELKELHPNKIEKIRKIRKY